MKGWFDAFRSDGGPTLYNFNNRTAVTGDVTLISFITIFCTIYVAFLIIYPGIRKERFSTFYTVTLNLFVGATILVSLYGSGWHVGKTSIISTYRAFSREKVAADLGVYIGLNHVNVTLQASPASNWTSDIEFNERFDWKSADKLESNFREAITRGLPFPILTVVEYFSLGQEGLSWGGQYRIAGYYATIMLWTSFTTWLLMNMLLAAVPRYGAMLMTICGLLLISTVFGYIQMLPENPLVIHIEGSTIDFQLGWCCWLILAAGTICLISGLIITAIEIFYPHSFSTILEVNYDTPYDRHILIEDSHGKRFQKKRSSSGKLEETENFGTRILRRLSSKTRDDKVPEKKTADNQVFEMDTPQSPWIYQIPRTTMSTPNVRYPASSKSYTEISLPYSVPASRDIQRGDLPRLTTKKLFTGMESLD
ncbi:dual oxidase maturation factor 1 [Agrilus planipennis]|uniref:Dual oxidase maturation factor 1 n=1 Tax=Agrilus planipennis TaxID=224129 RepID=A0A1W4WPR8_AGRPL|nr:dual oxidase maturation factor 1 [Agrilus planipennis]XP_018325915.1 dual oxidase maturation factor 1 [Agrilus planipennis]